jgi:cation transport ATPase
LIFQNEVREDSAEVIARLKHGDIRNIIITGKT